MFEKTLQKSHLIIFCFFTLLVLGFVSTANADSILRFTVTGESTVTIADNAAGDIDPTIGVIEVTDDSLTNAGFGGDLGNFSQLEITASSTSTAQSNTLAINSLDATSGAGGMLLIEFSAHDFTIPTGNAETSLGFGGSSTATGSLAANAWQDNSNAHFGMSTALVPVGTVSSALGNFFSDGSTGLIGGITSPYSMTTQLKLTHDAEGQSSFGSTAKIPLPSSLLFFAGGFAGFVAWRKKVERLAS